MDQNVEPYSVVKSLVTPTHISSLDFGHAAHLFAGSADGILRVYDLSSFKVLKAIRGLGDEISSIACVKRPGSELCDTWIACGNSISLFKMDNPAMIMAAQDTLRSIKLTEDDDDVLNEISVWSVVVDLSNMLIVRMKQKHASICGCVKFVPDRPRELVSAGYDETFLHFDFLEGTCISKYKISSTQTTEGVSLSPPFIMSTAMSSTGVLAAGTADGHLWLGIGGQKGLGKDKMKRSKKWNGLSDEEKQVYVKVADGPIVAMSFSTPTILTASTLMGSIIQWEINNESSTEDTVKEVWGKKALGLDKVNALVSNDTKIAIAGFSRDGKGIIEIWDKSVPAHTSTSV